MAITFTWLRKKLKEDDFGDVTDLLLSMQGTDGVDTYKNAMVVSFGGDDIKPIDEWTDAEIDTWAESNRSTLESAITFEFENS